MTNALTLPQRAAVALGTAEHEKQLILLVEESKTITAIKNADARTQCHGALMTLKNARVGIEKAGKAAREDATAFSKAVIAEENRLVALTKAEETRLQALRDKWDADLEAEHQAKIDAERKRIADIQQVLTDIRNAPLQVVGLSSAKIQMNIDVLESMVIDGSNQDFALDEFSEEARSLRVASLAKMREAFGAAINAEAEAARMKVEREALARLREEAAARRADDERKAAAARAAQEAELKAAREKQEAELAAQRAAAERTRKMEDEARAFKLQQEREVLEAQNAAMRLERANLERQQAELAEAQRKRAEQESADEQRITEIHRHEEAERVRLQQAANQALADARQPAVTEPAPAAKWPFPVETPKASTRPDDEEIIQVIANHFNVEIPIAYGWLCELSHEIENA